MGSRQVESRQIEQRASVIALGGPPLSEQGRLTVVFQIREGAAAGLSSNVGRGRSPSHKVVGFPSLSQSA